MKHITEIITEKLFETDNWLYIFIPNKHNQTNNWFLGINYDNVKIEEDFSKYVKIKTKKVLTDNNAPVINAWKRKYPGEKVPVSFTQFLSSLGDPEIEKMMNQLLKMVDSGKITLADFAKTWKESGVDKLSENPEKFKEILDSLK